MKKSRKRANPLVYYPLYWAICTYYRLINRVSLDVDATRHIEAPAVVLSTHPNFFDFIHTAMALYPRRITVVINRYYTQLKSLRGILSVLAAIPKRLFCADADTVAKIISSIRSGHIVALMPEGRLSTDGTGFFLAEGTARLIKKLGVSVYRVNTEGAYYLKPKWAQKMRKGSLKIVSEKLLDASEVREMSVAELDARLTEGMRYTSRALAPLRGCDDLAEGLEGILYRCPECGQEFCLRARNNTIKCEKCGFAVGVDRFDEFTGGPFKTIAEWNAMQRTDVLRVLDTLTLSARVTLKAMTADTAALYETGEGTCTLDRNELVYEGTCGGEVVRQVIPTERIEALAFDCAKSFDIYVGGTLYCLAFVENPNQAAKWSIFADLLTERRMREKTAEGGKK